MTKTVLGFVLPPKRHHQLQPFLRSRSKPAFPASWSWLQQEHPGAPGERGPLGQVQRDRHGDDHHQNWKVSCFLDFQVFDSHVKTVKTVMTVMTVWGGTGWSHLTLVSSRLRPTALAPSGRKCPSCCCNDSGDFSHCKITFPRCMDLDKAFTQCSATICRVGFQEISPEHMC